MIAHDGFVADMRYAMREAAPAKAGTPACRYGHRHVIFQRKGEEADEDLYSRD